jgi:hypothetical protein
VLALEPNKRLIPEHSHAINTTTRRLFKLFSPMMINDFFKVYTISRREQDRTKKLRHLDQKPNMLKTQETTTVEINTKRGVIIQPTGLFINNVFVPGSSSLETINPRSGEVICSVMSAGKEDVERAVSAASAAIERVEEGHSDRARYTSVPSCRPYRT